MEKSNYSKIALQKFYLRRVLRIWPLYYLIIVIGFFLVPNIQQLLGNSTYQENAKLLPFLFFYNNFVETKPTSAVLGVLWSIAIEEQFYLIWPILISIIPIKSIRYLCFSIISISVLIRMLIVGYGYENTFSCMSDFGVGGLLGYYTFYKPKWFAKIEQTPRSLILIIYIFGVSLFFVRGHWSDIPILYYNERIIFSFFFAFIIHEQNNFKNSFIKLGKFQGLSKLGVISYGLYMYHFVAIYIISMLLQKLSLKTELYQILFIEPLMALFLSILIALLSYKYFETPFLRLKRKLSEL